MPDRDRAAGLECAERTDGAPGEGRSERSTEQSSERLAERPTERPTDRPKERPKERSQERSQDRSCDVNKDDAAAHDQLYGGTPELLRRDSTSEDEGVTRVIESLRALGGKGGALRSSVARKPRLLLEHRFFRELPGWGGPGTGGSWEDWELEGSSIVVPALRDALDVQHFDPRCVQVLLLICT